MDVTCTLSPPTALSTLPQTPVEATTLILPPAAAAASPSPPEPEQAVTPSARTVSAEAAASTLLVRRELMEATPTESTRAVGISNGNRCQIHFNPISGSPGKLSSTDVRRVTARSRYWTRGVSLLLT